MCVELLVLQESTQLQTTFVTRNSLIFNSLAGAYFMAIIITGGTCEGELVTVTLLVNR